MKALENMTQTSASVFLGRAINQIGNQLYYQVNSVATLDRLAWVTRQRKRI